MLTLAAEAGLRRAEIARVHRCDLTRGPAGAELLVHGKGGKLRVVPIGDDLAAAIEKGVDQIDIPDGWLFSGTDDGHLLPRWVGKLMAGALPDHWTAHTLRHRFATRAYRGSRNLRAVQTLLGHSSVATTERYTAVDHDEIRAAAMASRRSPRRTPHQRITTPLRRCSNLSRRGLKVGPMVGIRRRPATACRFMCGGAAARTSGEIEWLREPTRTTGGTRAYPGF